MEPKSNAIDTEASRWAARLDAGPLSAEERAELDAWTTSDRRHHGALIRARAAWIDADRLAALAAGTVPTTSEPPTPALPSHASTRRTFAIAASVMLAVTASLAAYLYLERGAQTYASEIGEVRKIDLPDGSRLTLNTNTLAAVRFKETERGIELERGEALFNVEHNAARPFVVHANGVHIKAVGTAFTVRLDDARVDVLVTEGTVEVTRDGSRPQRITANHRAVIASGASRLDIEPVNPEGVTRQLAWREGMVAFAGEPLSVAVDEINRHSRRPIVVDDPGLAAQPIVGIFHANDAEAFARAAAATFGAEVIPTDNAIRLVSRQTETQ